jgi:hypothetical protein
MKRNLLTLLLIAKVFYSFCAGITDSINLVPKHYYDVGPAIGFTPIISKQAFSFDCHLEYSPVKHFYTGAFIVVTGRQTADSFGFTVKKPIVQFYEIGWINQYNVVETNKFRAGLNITNAFAQARLGDSAIKERQHKNRPKEITSNYLYCPEAGCRMYYKLSHEKESTHVWITADAGYRFAIGHFTFGNAGDFAGPHVNLGISMIGFDDPKAQPATKTL